MDVLAKQARKLDPALGAWIFNPKHPVITWHHGYDFKLHMFKMLTERVCQIGKLKLSDEAAPVCGLYCSEWDAGALLWLS